MIWFYVPFFYLIHSRLKTKFELISWQIIFFIPQLLITYYFLDIRSNIFLHLFLISQLIFFSMYETGYIENDIKTTQRETNPTIRLNKKNATFITKNYSKLTNLRYFIVVSFILKLLWLDTFTSYNLNLLSFGTILLFTKLIFNIHNKIRNRFNIITFFLLSILKFSFPLVLFINFEKITYPLLLALITFPILRTTEVITLKRYNFKGLTKLIGNIDKFRVIYYSFCLLVIITLKLFLIISLFEFYISITIFFYFLLFRVGCFFLVKYGLYKRDDKF